MSAASQREASPTMSRYDERPSDFRYAAFLLALRGDLDGAIGYALRLRAGHDRAFVPVHLALLATRERLEKARRR